MSPSDHLSEPTFDSDGYPTDETLDAIRQWSPLDIRGLMEFIAEAWRDFGFFEKRPPVLDEDNGCYWCCATGGWSGNESLLGALGENVVAYAVSWNLSRRGGYHEFHVPKYEGGDTHD